MTKDQYNQQELWDAVQREGSVRAAGRALGIPESTLRGRLKDFTPEVPSHAFVPTAKELPAPHVEHGGVETRDYWAEHEKTGGTRRYILTSAQNNCRVHPQFLANLKALAAEVDAELLISCTIYDRQGYRGLVRKGSQKRTREVWWDRAIQPYMVNMRCRLHRRLAFCGEMDILATAKRPLSGLDSYCGRSSIIVPHNRFSLRCVESRAHQMPKEMATTGSVTLRKFIQRKTGQLAQFHHVLGALLVEVSEDGYWYTHHLNAEEDGSFYWLDRRVENGTVDAGHAVEALVLGDVHHEKLDVQQDTVAQDVVRTLAPSSVFIHDLIDFRSRNHHNRKDPLFRVRVGQEDVCTELVDAGHWLSQWAELVLHTPNPGLVYVVASNHNRALGRWIREADWREDEKNAEVYLTIALEMVRAAEQGIDLDPLQWFLQHHVRLAEGVVFLRTDESVEIKGVECGIHGDIGLSGSRGTPRSYSKLGFKTVTAHTHTPSIMDGCYTVGLLGKLDMEYNQGPSKWLHAHVIIYPNGKRAFIWSKNGRWRAE